MRVADGVYVITDSSGMVNAGLIQFDDGLIVVDTMHNATEAERIVRYAADELRLPIKAVILTHEHFDHTGGLPAFSVPVIASEVTA
ncbi:MAG: MBL fold metallo-hydrolase, partial [Bacillota bacterium]